MADRDEDLRELRRRAGIYLRGIGLTDGQVSGFFRSKRCRVYELREGRHLRLSCFDRDLNRRLHETYGIGSREFRETMWTRTRG